MPKSLSERKLLGKQSVPSPLPPCPSPPLFSPPHATRKHKHEWTQQLPSVCSHTHTDHWRVPGSRRTVCWVNERENEWRNRSKPAKEWTKWWWWERQRRCCWLKTKAKCESYESRFIWASMRAATWETHLWRLWETAPKTSGQEQYVCDFGKGEVHVVRHVYFFRKFLLVLWSFC